MELADEGIAQRTAKTGESLEVRAMEGRFALLALVSPKKPTVAVHPPAGAVLAISGIPETRQKDWGITSDKVIAIAAPFRPEETGTDYDGFMIENGPKEAIDLRACVCGMRVEVLSRR